MDMNTLPGEAGFISLLTDILGDTEIFGESGVCPAQLETTDTSSRILIVSGENGSGKSLLLRALGAHLRRIDKDIPIFDAGLHTRTPGGFSRLYIEGEDEEEASYGLLSASAVNRTLIRLRTEKKPYALFLDSPDLGLDEAWAMALSDKIMQFAARLPDCARALVIASHNRNLLKGIANIGAHSIRMGKDERSLGQWLTEGPQPRQGFPLLDDFDERRIRIREQWAAIQRIMERRRLKAG